MPPRQANGIGHELLVNEVPVGKTDNRKIGDLAGALEAGKKRLAGDTVREATSDEVKDLRRQNSELKYVVAEVTLENRVLKKSLTGFGDEDIDS